MKTQADITVARAAIRQGRACGLYGDTEARVRGIAARSVPIRHSSGNRMYGPFILYMRGAHVVSFSQIGPRGEDTRPVSECKLCGGLMSRRIETILNGRTGYAHRPCPRAFNTTAPLCDTKES